ncbi:energy transducer TonB family protein [Formosa algae]|uniref:Protein TonB n=1 Tax=Formosa algae TaxID=225843 RepID=A0A9X0YHJ9_9FLAO|nr:energy transducer TonB [Formosa algae]MBP1838360.1 protein TonB [Formosa algae]MDQ0334495.1 protein TonB [Formosa algae]
MTDLKQKELLLSKNNDKSDVIRSKDVQLKNNTMIYFQIGLIVCLLLVYGLLETSFKQDALPKVDYAANIEESSEYMMDDFIIYEAPKDAPSIEQKTVKKTILSDTPIIVDDDATVETDFKDVFTQSDDAPVLKDASDLDIVEVPEDEDEIFNMMGVEVVPVFPGCESSKSNEARKTCMSEKLSKLIQKKFNVNLASEEGLTGIQKIHVQFKINNKGEVTDVKARAPNKTLENEAKRVIGQVPTMIPGKQRNKNVSVMYTMPILFKVQN